MAGLFYGVGWFTHSALRKVSPQCRLMVLTQAEVSLKVFLGQPDVMGIPQLDFLHKHTQSSIGVA